MLRVLCAWHPKYFPSEPVPVLRESPSEDDRTSHGVCGDCRAFLRTPSPKAVVARRDRRLYEVSKAAPEEWPTRPIAAPKKSSPNAIRTRNSLAAGTQRKNLIGKFTVKLFDGERFDVLVHRQGRDIMLNDSRVGPVNQIHQLGWEREIYLKVSNIADLDYRPFGHQPLIWA